jgi:hypothetical protein
VLPLLAVTLPSVPTVILDRSRQLCHAAEILVEEAKAQVSETLRHRSERHQWRTVWSEYSLSSDHVLVCCASCARLHRSSGEWTPISPEISKKFYLWNGATLSHSLCPDCLAGYLPPQPEGLETR